MDNKDPLNISSDQDKVHKDDLLSGHILRKQPAKQQTDKNRNPLLVT